MLDKIIGRADAAWGVEPACFMVGSTRKTLGTTETASRDLKPSDRFLRLRRDRTSLIESTQANDASIQQVNQLLTLAINGGLNGLAARLFFYKRALKVLAQLWHFRRF